MDEKVPGKKTVLVGCGVNPQDELSYLVGIITQTFLLLTISHLLHLVLRRLRQPSAISQMLAGIILGRSGIASIPVVGVVVFPDTNMDYLSSTAALGRMFYMFLVGLEMDIPYFLRTTRRAVVIAGGGAAICLVVGGAFSPLVYWQTNANGSRFLFALTLMLVFTNTASPVLMRMTEEIKLSSTDFGRLAVTSAIVNDIACLFLLAFITSSPNSDFSFGKELGMLVGAVALLTGAAYLSRIAIRWLNRRNRQRKHIKNAEVVSLLLFIVGVSSLTEMMGYNSMMASFILGLVFPREGCTTRTLINKLTYPVRNVLLPVYIGYAGVQTNLRVMNQGRYIAAVLTVVSLSSVAKVGGTLMATTYLNMPRHEGTSLGFLLNVKGHVDLIVLGLARKHRIWGADAFMVLLVTVLMSTLMVGPVVAALVKRERRQHKSMASGLQHQSPDTELKFLACVHSPRDAPAVLNLVEISTGADRVPVSVYMLHLVELQHRTSTAVLYHQQKDIDDKDDDDYGGDHAKQINVSVDAFMVEVGIRIRQLTTVSSFGAMDTQICHRAKDVRASIVIVPFHKFQRVDGKMVGGKDGIRVVNMKVLQQAPCTVGILVDRGLSGMTQITDTQGAFQVATLFFGGPDDREAVALSSRLALHPGVSLKVVRFLPTSAREDGIKMKAASKKEEVVMDIPKQESEADRDDNFLSSFYNRFVVSSVVTYEERFVEDGPEAATAIAELGGLYSLFLVGRRVQGMSPLTYGLRGREEFPELGVVGDLLASSTLTTGGSVLVLQQQGKLPADKNEDGQCTRPL